MEWQRESLAIAFHQPDEAVWLRQSPQWLERLTKMVAAQGKAATGNAPKGDITDAQGKSLIRQMTGG